MSKSSMSVCTEEHIKALIKTNVMLRKKNSALLAKVTQMIYQHRYYMKTRGRNIKEREIIARQNSRNIHMFGMLRKLINMSRKSEGDGRYLMRLTRAQIFKLKNLLKIDLRKFNNPRGGR